MNRNRNSTEREEVMDGRQFYSGKFLRAADLPKKRNRGTITGVRSERFEARDGKPAETKLVVSFKQFGKPLVLNKTNYDTLEELFGSETDGWIGKTVALLQATVRMDGK